VRDAHRVAWLRAPDGTRVFSVGVNTLDGGELAGAPQPATYHWSHVAPSLDAWVAATQARLSAWGFNTAGAWAADASWQLPVIPDLDLGATAAFHWGDPFDPALDAAMPTLARRLVAPWRGRRGRIGYFLDNEVGWWNGALFTWFARQPGTSHTKRRLVALLRVHYGDDWSRFTADFVPPRGVTSFAELTDHAGTFPRLRAGGDGIAVIRRWTGVVAARYYALASAAVRAADPGALVFSDRLPIYYDPEAVRALVPYVDVVATNYDVDSPDGWVARYYFDGLRTLTGGKPVLVSEWFFAARENRTGNRNNGHLMTVGTQAERAEGAARAARAFAALPEIVGLHWFQYYDHPAGGRADGEDYDFGLVDVRDRPYQTLVARLGAVNRELPAEHAAARRPAPPALAIPEAHIDVADRSLADWPKPAALLPPLRPSAGDVPFGDVLLAWSADGLHLGLVAMDYWTPGLLAGSGDVPASEAFRVALGIDAGRGARRVTLTLVPPRDVGTGEAPLLVPQLAACDADACRGVARASATYFGSDQPRITAEATIPWTALGRTSPPRSLRLAVAVTAFHRARWMTLDGAPPALSLGDARRWRRVPLLSASCRAARRRVTPRPAGTRDGCPCPTCSSARRTSRAPGTRGRG
jgi:hypothetical protein